MLLLQAATTLVTAGLALMAEDQATPLARTKPVEKLSAPVQQAVAVTTVSVHFKMISWPSSHSRLR